MKKLIAIILSAMLLFSACAFAAGSELTISNLTFSANDTVIDLSGIDLRFAVAANENAAGLNIALDAQGQNVVNATAEMLGEKIVCALSGVSSAYSLSLMEVLGLIGLGTDAEVAADAADGGIAEGSGNLDSLFSVLIEELEAVLFWAMDTMEVLNGCVVDQGEQILDDVPYQLYGIYLGEDQVDAIFRGLIEILDRHPELTAAMLQGSGFASLMEFYDAVGISLKVDGTAAVAEDTTEFNLSLILGAPDGTELAFNTSAFVATIPDEANGINTDDSVVVLSVESDGESQEILTTGMTVNKSISTGKFYSADGYMMVPMAEDVYVGMMYGLYSPEMTGDLWSFEMQDMNGQFSFIVSTGTAEGVSVFQINTAAADSEMTIYYEGVDGAGEVGIIANDGTEEMKLSGNVVVQENDGAWLISDASNAINVLEMTEEEREVLTGELTGVLLSAVYQLAAANETIGAMIGSLLA